MIDKGLDPTDRPSFARVQWKVRDTLTRLNKRGLHAFGRRGPWRPLADRRSRGLTLFLLSAMALPISNPGT